MIETASLIDSNSERQNRPLAEQTLDEFDEFFRSCPGMTFVFLAPGEVNTLYPDVITAMQVVYCSSRGCDFEPAFEYEPPLPPADAFSRQQLVSEIQARVGEMDRRGVQYRLIWNVAGDPEVCVDSCDMDDNTEIGFLLAEEVQELFAAAQRASLTVPVGQFYRGSDHGSHRCRSDCCIDRSRSVHSWMRPVMTSVST